MYEEQYLVFQFYNLRVLLPVILTGKDWSDLFILELISFLSEIDIIDLLLVISSQKIAQTIITLFISYNRILLLTVNNLMSFLIRFIFIIIIFLVRTDAYTHKCVHLKSGRDQEIAVYDDIGNGRRLQQKSIGPIRIHLEDRMRLAQFAALVRPVMDVAINFFQNFLTVPQEESILFPASKTSCHEIAIPPYLLDNGRNSGIKADFGLILADEREFSTVDSAVASCLPCTTLKSTNRPYWGAMKWYFSPFAEYFETVTPSNFQTLVYVAIHEMTHALAMSLSLYPFIKAIQIKNQSSDPFMIGNEYVRIVAQRHFNCSSLEGFGLELESTSHWEEQHVGDELMITQVSPNPYIGQFTVALFEVSTWYPSVNRKFIEPTFWGKNRGCSFYQKQCNFSEYCQKESEISCTFNSEGSGQCQGSSALGSCKSVPLDENFICTDPNYLQTRRKAFTPNFQAYEQSGKSSRCFKSDFRELGNKAVPNINTRCYKFFCLGENKFIGVKVKDKVLICLYQGFKLKADFVEGTLECPMNFDKICSAKKQCAYDCGMSGMCVNGQCLCKQSNNFTGVCQDQTNRLLLETKEEKMLRVEDICTQNHIFDPITKKCQFCLQLLGCQQCNESGCLSCLDGNPPIHGHCL